MIEVQQLGKRFGAVTAVRDLSFKAGDGAITGLLGSNGAGKTTTLRMIGGILEPQHGRVRIDGVPADKDRLATRQRFGALLDDTGLYGRLSARENLAYFGRLYGIPQKGLDLRVEEVLKLLRLESVADRRTAGFSQGERMKVALGRAIIPRAIFCWMSQRTALIFQPFARCAPYSKACVNRAFASSSRPTSSRKFGSYAMKW